MVTPPDWSTWTCFEMRQIPNITATALSMPKPTITPTIISTILRAPLDGAAAVGACPTGTCPAGATPAGVAAAAAKPVGMQQPPQNFGSENNSAPPVAKTHA